MLTIVNRDINAVRIRPQITSKTTTAPSSGAVGLDSKWGDTESNLSGLNDESF